MEQIDFRPAVQTGADLLTERFPTWLDAVDMERLDLGAYATCVLGQTARKFEPEPDPVDRDPWVAKDVWLAAEWYEAFAHTLGAPGDLGDFDFRTWAARHGFDLPDEAYNDGAMTPKWEALTVAWRAEIAARKVARS